MTRYPVPVYHHGTNHYSAFPDARFVRIAIPTTIDELPLTERAEAYDRIRREVCAMFPGKCTLILAPENEGHTVNDDNDPQNDYTDALADIAEWVAYAELMA